jgi:CubicO group peptidase (beta-lactamase class C family)
VPAQRAITLRDLLTSTMGFGSIMAMPDTYPIQKLIREYRIGGDGPMLPTHAPGMNEWLQKLGSLPWLAQPGERWMYHVSIDALGALKSDGGWHASYSGVHHWPMRGHSDLRGP